MKGKIPSKEDARKTILGLLQSTAFLSWSGFSYSVFICSLRFAWKRLYIVQRSVENLCSFKNQLRVNFSAWFYAICYFLCNCYVLFVWCNNVFWLCSTPYIFIWKLYIFQTNTWQLQFSDCIISSILFI